MRRTTIIIFIALLFVSFLLGRCSKKESMKTITLPAIKGKSDTIFSPIPIKSVRDSIRYKDSTIYSKAPFDKELVQNFIDTASDIDKIDQYIKAVETNEYNIPYKDDFLSIDNHVKVQGKLLSFQQDYEIKSKEIDVKNIDKNYLLMGTSISNTAALDKFDITIQAGLQKKDGDIILAGYSIIGKSVQLGYIKRF